MDLRDNYFVKLNKYIKNVYNIDKQMEHTTDKRLNPKYKTPQIISLVLTGFLLRVKSFNRMNFMIKAGEFDNIASYKNGVPRIDAIRNSLKSIDISILRKINENVIKKSVRNKVLSGGTIDGLNVAAIDGTNLFNNQKSHCDDCILKRNKGKEYYSHSCAVMSLIGDGPSLVLDYEMNKHKNVANDTGAGELVSSQKLLNRVVSAHNGLIDVVAYDALACNSTFINECIKLNVDAVVRIKKSHIRSIKKVKKLTNKKKYTKKWYDGTKRIKAYESLFYMDGVERRLRYIKFRKKYRNGDRSQVLIVTTSMILSVKTIYRIMKARWNLENRVFNNLKNNAHLNHCFVHGGNAVEAVLYLMFIASNLLNLFKERRLKNHVSNQTELVRLLLKGLYFVDDKSTMIMCTG